MGRKVNLWNYLRVDLYRSIVSDVYKRQVLYNPVYMGKIAYGRRRTEKKQGTRNEMHVVLVQILLLNKKTQAHIL